MTALGEPRTLLNDAAIAAVHDHGAHLVHWQPTGVEPVLWMSGRSALDSESPIRGGVPICFPWFGAGRTGKLVPAHGIARLRRWELVGVVQEPALTRASYLLDIGPSDGFPHALRAKYVVSVGSELGLELTVTNTGAGEASFEEALHTYFAVSDIHDVRVTGLDGARYKDKAPGATAEPVTQAGDVLFTGETDRVYASTSDVAIVDTRMQRRIIVTKTGSANTVVWNPWAAKAAAMADFGDDEWPGMVCVEGANVGDDAIVLAPGASHTLEYRVRVESLG